MAIGVARRDASASVATAVVVSFQSQSLLPRCLAALDRAQAAAGPLEVIVADNASTDGSVQVAQAALPSARIVPMGANRGYAAAINAAVRARGGAGPILVLNPDARLRDGCLGQLLRALDRPGVGVAVPRLVDGAGGLAHSLRREPSVGRAWAEALIGGRRASRIGAMGEVVGDPTAYALPHRVAWATGAVLLISAECARVVGEWDESYFLYSEETDYLRRVREGGFDVWYEPAAVAEHDGGASSTSPELWSLLTRNRVRYFTRHHGRLASAAFRGAVVTNEAIRAVSGSPTHRRALRDLTVGRSENSTSAGASADGTPSVAVDRALR